MRNGWKVSIWFALVAALLLVASSAVQAQEYRASTGAQNDSAVLTLNISPKDQAKAAAFWTPEERAKAQPMPLLSVTDSGQAVAAAQAQPAGPPTKVEGGLPDPKIDALARKLYPAEWAAIDSQMKNAPQTLGGADTTTTADVDPYTASTANFNRYAVNYYAEMWKSYPYRTMGVLIFKTPGSTSYSLCSASVVANKGVLTAGHCVYTPGRGWHNSFIFYPAYRFGVAPYGGFTPFGAAVLNNWAVNGSTDDDVAMLAISNKSGYTVGQWVGWMGLSWNATYNQLMHAFGYPNNIGGTQYSSVCVGESWLNTSGGSVGMGCDMTYGSSGGPWLRLYGPYTLNNYVNSVVSGGNPSIPKFYGPYFDSNNIKILYDWVSTK